jgi:hypothetical protein
VGLLRPELQLLEACSPKARVVPQAVGAQANYASPFQCREPLDATGGTTPFDASWLLDAFDQHDKICNPYLTCHLHFRLLTSPVSPNT